MMYIAYNITIEKYDNKLGILTDCYHGQGYFINES